MKTTLSVIKADVGGYVGHSSSHPNVIDTAKEAFEQAKRRGLLCDFRVLNCGDDLQLIMTHEEGEQSSEIHRLAWDTFLECTRVAKNLKLHGAGQDLLSDAFSGNVRGLGPGVAEMDISERDAETVIVFMADKTSAGAWNLPLYRMFADPFNTIGLVIASRMHNGFSFEVHDVVEHKKVLLNTPEEIYDLLVFLGSPSRYAINAVYHKDSGDVAACASTQRVSVIAGKYVGKDDPVCAVRAQGNFPAVGEVLEPFASLNLVKGWMRGSHHGPLLPVAFKDSKCTRFDGPPRVIAAGFQLANGALIGPSDLFDDMAFDPARREALDMADRLRSAGPFEPHRLPMEEMEYTTMPEVIEKLSSRFVPLEEKSAVSA